jgi:hypothetical protein
MIALLKPLEWPFCLVSLILIIMAVIKKINFTSHSPSWEYQLVSLLINSSSFTEHDCSLPCSQNPRTGSCPVQDALIVHHYFFSKLSFTLCLDLGSGLFVFTNWHTNDAFTMYKPCSRWLTREWKVHVCILEVEKRNILIHFSGF